MLFEVYREPLDVFRLLEEHWIDDAKTGMMLTQQFFIPLGEKKFCYKAEQAWAWESFFTETRNQAPQPTSFWHI